MSYFLAIKNITNPTTTKTPIPNPVVVELGVTLNLGSDNTNGSTDTCFCCSVGGRDLTPEEAKPIKFSNLFSNPGAGPCEVGIKGVAGPIPKPLADMINLNGGFT